MRSNACAAAAAAVVGLTCAAAPAQQAIVDAQGGPLNLNAGAIATSLQTLNGLGSGAVSAIQSELAASGVETVGHVTAFFANTDVGLSWFVLVDGGLDPAGSELGMTTTAPDDVGFSVNDSASDITNFFDSGNGFHTAGGVFDWGGDDQMDAFVWTGLGFGDFVSFNFTDMGVGSLDSAGTFQFVNSVGGEWQVVASDTFSANDQFAYTFTIIPGAPTMALLGLAAIGARRRRRA